MPFNRREWSKRWEKKNKVKRRKQYRLWASKHREQINASGRRSYKAHAQRCRDYVNKKNVEQRIIVLKHYGGTIPKCACCGETIERFLTIDHINMDGAKHRKELGGIKSRGGNKLVGWLIRNNYPEGFRVLCWNCNCGSFKYGGACPHTNPIKIIPINLTPQQKYSRRRYREKKLDIFSYYAKGIPRCNCCGETNMDFLTLDHMNNDGAKHRMEISGQHAGGAKVYDWILKNNYPKGFQVLCFNCNCGKQINGGACPHKEVLHAKSIRKK